MTGILAASFLACASLHARTANLPAQIEEIRALLEPDDSDSQQAKILKAELRRLPDSWQQMLENDQLTEFSRFRANMDLTPLPDVAAKITELFQDAKAEHDRRETVKIAKAEALLDHIGESLKAAQKAEELDALMLTLSKTKIADYDNNRKLAALSRDLQNALQIVTYWQDYLLAKETGNLNDIRTNLERITQQLASTPLIERSFVLRLLKSQAPKSAGGVDSPVTDPRSPLDEIQAKLAETGDSAAALAALKSIPRSQLSRADDEFLLRSVQAIEDLRKLEPTMAESEVFANIRNIQGSQSQGRYSISRATDQVALNAIARSYGIDTPDVKTTSARKVLETMATAASKDLDLPKLRKTLNFLDSLGTSSYAIDSQKRSSDLKIIALVGLGTAAEQHNDLESAAAAYLEASSIDGQYLQREVPYAKLAALKEKAPDKIGPILTKAEENRQRMEAIRNAADLEARNQMMSARGSYADRMRRDDPAALHSLIEEVVAEFLKEKRLEGTKKTDKDTKSVKEPAARTE